jgi:hypothetical protein
MILKKSIILISKEGNSDGTRRVPDLSRLSTEGLSDVFELYAQELGSSTNAETLKSLFEAAYLKHDNLADATRQCEFTFGTYGLVILDADDADLKRLLFLLQKNYYTKLPIKQYLKQPKN